MNYLEIIELVKRLKVIEETLTYWRTPTYTSSIESTLHNIKRLEQEKEEIKFQLEFTYLLFELLTQVEEIEGARVRIYKREKDVCAISVNYKSSYHFILTDEANKEAYKELADFIEECRERKVSQDKEDLQIALNKLTDREKELIKSYN